MRFVLALFGALLAVIHSAAAEPLADFYNGKTMVIIVGSEAGGGYDALARLLSRHIAKHIPGTPKVVVQNMPGASSIIAANYIYGVAPQDGTVIGVMQRGILTARMLELPNVKFDTEKVYWLGNMSSEPAVVLLKTDGPVKNLADLLEKEVVVGGSGPTADTETAARLMNALVGTHFKIISGYRSNTENMLAMERGEIQGVADFAWSNLKRKPTLLKEGKVRIIVQHGLTPSPDLKDVPMTLSLAKTDLAKAALELYFAQKSVGRPVMIGPGVPADRAAALRTALEQTIVDPEFKSDAQKSDIDMDPTPASSIEQTVQMIKTANAEVKAIMIDTIGGRAH